MQANIHNALKDDIAYQWSVAHDDAFNMRIVLRAYGYPYTYAAAEEQIAYAAAN